MEHLSIKLPIVYFAGIVNVLPIGNQQTDIAATACCIRQWVRIVGRCHKRGKTWTVFLRTSINGAPVHLAFRERLLQSGMLAGTDSVQFVKVHQQIVGQCHLLVELVRKVQMVEIILAQFDGQQAMEESGLATALRTNQRGHTFVAVQGVHLQPVGHSRQ